jgi:putative membrane protein
LTCRAQRAIIGIRKRAANIASQPIAAGAAQAERHVRRKRGNEMADTPYSRFGKDELILRDELAIDRTLLANERTLLAYLRSAIALLIAGVSIMHFSERGWFWTLGVCCIPLGILVGVFGIVRFQKMNRAITIVRTRTKSLAEPNFGDSGSRAADGATSGAPQG